MPMSIIQQRKLKDDEEDDGVVEAANGKMPEWCLKFFCAVNDLSSVFVCWVHLKIYKLSTPLYFWIRLLYV